MSQSNITFVGSIERIVYQQPENGFMIAIFDAEELPEPITIKGTIFNVSEQSMIEIKGHWEMHKIYGKQFFVAEFAPILPKSAVGIERYLISEIQGIGKKTASRIVKEFGENTFQVIDENPQELLQVPKFNKKQLKQLLEVWENKKEERNVLTFLHEIGSSSTQALKIYKHYGKSTIPKLQANPYQLTELHGIGFQIADQLARNLGFDENSPQRAIAGVLYMLNQLSHHGHTCYPRHALIEKTSQELRIEAGIVENAVQHLLQTSMVKTKNISLPLQDHVPTDMIAHPKLYDAEQNIADNIWRISNGQAYTEFDDTENLITGIEKKIGLTLDAMQKTAVEAALEHKILIITGGPGTGKTTIIRFILELIRRHIPEVSLAAPTGRAAKRLSDANQRPASTIHRLLGASRMGFERNREDPIDSELIIIDEVSMIDTMLMSALVEAIRSEARLILVGDVDQLPSVGPGAILQNLIFSKVIPVMRLETIFRQASDSLITVNAHNVRKGIFPEFTRPTSDELLDFYFMEESNPEKVVEKIILMATERIPKRFDFDPKTDIQILTPMHRGTTGSIHLNQQLQKAMNTSSTFLQYKDIYFKAGDKVIQQQNSYEKEVFNGDVGIISRCDPVSKLLVVQFDGNEVTYEGEEMDDLGLAYAISVHKSQGSEYPAVILPLTTHHYVMLQRNLLYTAMTRGKELVVIIGMKNAMQIAVDNASPNLRYTLLQSEFEELWRDSATRQLHGNPLIPPD
ncbi:MAG: ATP-dependent RecD-like DNA helicase [SAR324 cluster bacterium]|nr:ATP-dependent RecD-like DNA helicase [SAR324 cluster bacterium]